jgi:hypothetical protein
VLIYIFIGLVAIDTVVSVVLHVLNKKYNDLKEQHFLMQNQMK